MLDDDSRFIIWCKARQIGGSWGAALKIADNAMKTGEDWIILSRSLRQAKRFLKKVALHIRAMNQIRTQKYNAESMIENIGAEQIELRNGSAIMAMPCDDETTVGDAANVVIDEFGLFPNSEHIFEALTPCIMNGFRILILSTPRGKKNKFAKLFNDGANGWSKHRTTIYDAEAGGLIIPDEKGRRVTAQEFLDDLRRKGMSEQAIRQEFLCEFIDEATAFMTLELIRKIQNKALDIAPDWNRIRRPGAAIFIGMDIGRFNDPTIIWIWEKLAEDQLVCRGMIEMRGVPFEGQQRRLEEFMPFAQKCCIDATGMGIDISERLAERWGAHRIEKCTFTETVKAEIATAMKSRAERAEIAIPCDERIESDFHMIEQHVTERGTVQYRADRSSDGHADRFWAAGLGVRAAGGFRPYELVMAFAE